MTSSRYVAWTRLATMAQNLCKAGSNPLWNQVTAQYTTTAAVPSRASHGTTDGRWWRPRLCHNTVYNHTFGGMICRAQDVTVSCQLTAIVKCAVTKGRYAAGTFARDDAKLTASDQLESFLLHSGKLMPCRHTVGLWAGRLRQEQLLKKYKYIHTYIHTHTYIIHTHIHTYTHSHIHT